MVGVSLRPISLPDLPLLLAWSYIPEIWTYLPTSRKGEKLTWERHLKWYESKQDRVDFMICYDERPVGVIHIKDLSSKYPEIGLYVGEVTLWDSLIGKSALIRGISWATENLEGDGLVAVIHPKNIPSIKLFTGLGFVKQVNIKTKLCRKGQDLYELNFRTISRHPVTVPAA